MPFSLQDFFLSAFWSYRNFFLLFPKPIFLIHSTHFFLLAFNKDFISFFNSL